MKTTSFSRDGGLVKRIADRFCTYRIPEKRHVVSMVSLHWLILSSSLAIRVSKIVAWAMAWACISCIVCAALSSVSFESSTAIVYLRWARTSILLACPRIFVTKLWNRFAKSAIMLPSTFTIPHFFWYCNACTRKSMIAAHRPWISTSISTEWTLLLVNLTWLRMSFSCPISASSLSSISDLLFRGCIKSKPNNPKPIEHSGEKFACLNTSSTGPANCEKAYTFFQVLS
ncbi:hypothetical protein B0O99DRAFT_626113 [Bisporella sp. PMI_857]|nr:hypothetical protein B0O99DRAFT_626113 [Bisporella sp. PMI_857]